MKILAANRLTDGEAVWLGEDDIWVEDVGRARIVRDKEGEESLLRAGEAAFLRNEVVDAELVDIELVEGSIRPLRLRERIRAAGPTIHPEIGKQALRRAVTLV